MQLTEASVIGVRSAVITMRWPGTQLRIRLFPMLHLGTAAFYREVTEQLCRCDVVVAEGVGGDSVLTRALTLAHRSPARSKRLGLVVQDIDYVALGFRLFGTRRMFGSHLELGDLPTSRAEEVSELSPAIEKLLVDDRDKLLVAGIYSLISERADEPLAVGVLYGAGHMPAVVRALAAVGFQPGTAEWLTVFGYD